MYRARLDSDQYYYYNQNKYYYCSQKIYITIYCHLQYNELLYLYLYIIISLKKVMIYIPALVELTPKRLSLVLTLLLLLFSLPEADVVETL